MTSKVKNVVAKCPRISVRELARILNTDYTSIHRILMKDMQMQKVCSVWVPTVLSEKNKKDRIICCKRILKDVSVSKSPYSPDINLCDRFLFTRLQEHCRAKEHGNGEELYIDAKRYLRSLPEDLLLHELNKLLEHCRAVIREAGAYVTI